MKKAKSLIFLFLALSVLVVIYIFVRKGDPLRSDYFELTSPYYLKKTDYFSRYDLIKSAGDQYEHVVSGVRGIAPMRNSHLIQFGENSDLHYLYISPGREEPVISRNLNDLDTYVQAEEIKWKKPWQIVEAKTLGNNSKLMSQILLIFIITLGFYLLMRIFNLKRIKRLQ